MSSSSASGSASAATVLIALGLLLLAHAAYSAMEFLAWNRLAVEHITPLGDLRLPNDIIVESLLALCICTWGVLQKVGSPQSIHLSDLQMLDYTLLCPSFRPVGSVASTTKK